MSKETISKKQVEKKLNKAVSHAVPDLKDTILKRCEETNVKYVPMMSAKKREKKYRQAVFFRIAVAAAAVLLLLNIGIIGIRGTVDKQIYTTIDIDVNPSIEIKVNNKDRVVEVNAVNDDAIKIIGDMDLTGAKTNVAVNALLGSMLSHGYLTDDTRTILVSVDSNDKENAKKVKEDIAKDIGGMLNTYSVSATVVSQTMTTDDTMAATIAGEYGISQGKAEFVQKIISADTEYTPEELSAMSVTELDTILSEVGVTEDIVQVITTGSSSDEIIIVENTSDDDSDEDSNSDEGNGADISDTDSSSSADNVGSDKTDSDKTSHTDNTDGLSESVSDNSISENSVSSNSASENTDNEDTSVSNNSVSSNSVSSNSVSDNSVSKNSVSSNSVSENNATRIKDDKSKRKTEH